MDKPVPLTRKEKTARQKKLTHCFVLDCGGINSFSCIKNDIQFQSSSVQQMNGKELKKFTQKF